MFDTHCHLNFDVFDNNLDQVIKDARESGVKKFLVPAVNIDSSKKAIEIAENYENTYAAIGIHPTEELEKLDLPKTLLNLESLAGSSDKILAIGEIGLDYYRHTAPTRIQREFLIAQIKLAVKLDKAIVLHNRHSGQDLLEILDENWSPGLEHRIVFHYFEPSKKILQKAKTKKIFIGIDGDITYDKVKQRVLADFPLDLVVLETDSPFVTPLPTKQEIPFPNQPKNLSLVAQKLAEIKNIDLEKVINRTTQNANRLFGLS